MTDPPEDSPLAFVFTVLVMGVGAWMLTLMIRGCFGR